MATRTGISGSPFIIGTAGTLAAFFLPGIGPASPSTAVRQATLTELLSGSWSGTWTRKGQTDAGAFLRKGKRTLPMLPPGNLPLNLIDEGRGRFRGKLCYQAILGIWHYERGVLTLCWRSAEKGYPERFSDEDSQDLLELRMK